MSGGLSEQAMGEAVEAAAKAEPASRIMQAPDGCSSIVLRTNEEAAQIALEAALPVLLESGELVTKGAVQREYIVCHARGYPDPYRVWPPTQERAEEFQRGHGGTIKTRLVTEWTAVARLGSE